MDGVKKRKSAIHNSNLNNSISSINSHSTASSTVYNPFSHRGSFTIPGSCSSKQVPLCEADVMDISDSSFGSLGTDESDFGTVCCGSSNSSNTKSLYAVKILSILLIGFAAGLLYHLAVSSSSPWSSTTNNAAVLIDEEAVVLTDELVKKLAAQNQLQEHEIEELKRQVLAQQEQQRLERLRIEQEEREEELSRQRQEADKERRRQIQQHTLDNLHFPPREVAQGVLQRLQEQYSNDDHPQPQHPQQQKEQPKGEDKGHIYVPEREWHADEPIYLQQYHKNHPHPKAHHMPKPKHVINMNDPAEAQAHIVGHIDEDTGSFVFEGDARPNLRGT